MMRIITAYFLKAKSQCLIPWMIIKCVSYHVATKFVNMDIGSEGFPSLEIEMINNSFNRTSKKIRCPSSNLIKIAVCM